MPTPEELAGNEVSHQPDMSCTCNVLAKQPSINICAGTRQAHGTVSSAEALQRSLDNPDTMHPTCPHSANFHRNKGVLCPHSIALLAHATQQLD